MMVETMLRAVLTMARVLVTMLLQISWTPPGGRAEVSQIQTRVESTPGVCSVLFWSDDALYVLTNDHNLQTD
jgi:hypothetical protein